MTGAEVIDFHAHVFPAALPDLSASTGDPRWPHLVIDGSDETSGEILLGSRTMRKVKRPLWDLPARVAVMDDIGIDVQVLSPMPIALTYWADPDDAQRFAQAMNDQIAEAVAASGGRVLGLATVPLQDPVRAMAEMKRAVDTLHLQGVEIGSRVGDAELNDPELRPFFKAAAEWQVPLFIHPTDGAGATRCSSPIIDFAIGMHTDTSLVGYALVYGGVLEELPELRVCLSHGGGSFPWTHPRLRIFDQRPNDQLDALVARLWTDALVFDASHLGLLVERFGTDHLVLGSDYPFITPEVHDPRSIIEQAVVAETLTQLDADRVLGSNVRAFLTR